MPKRLTLPLILALVVTIIVAGTAIIVLSRRTSAPTVLRPSGLPAAVTTNEANLMALSPVPSRPAPAFTLTDQHGRTISLASLRGRPVVINFMDPHCVDICPLVAQELRYARADLTGAAKDTVFIGINVNPYARSVANMATFTNTHLLNTIPTWHFLTGTVPALKTVWHAYGVVVQAASPTADVVHTAVTYFIDPAGNERYVAIPVVDHNSSGAAFLPGNTLQAWGRGIAAVAESLAR